MFSDRSRIRTKTKRQERRLGVNMLKVEYLFIEIQKNAD